MCTGHSEKEHVAIASSVRGSRRRLCHREKYLSSTIFGNPSRRGEAKSNAWTELRVDCIGGQLHELFNCYGWPDAVRALRLHLSEFAS